MATNLIERIERRKHNEYCQQASLHGYDTKNLIKEKPVEIESTPEQDKQAELLLQRMIAKNTNG